MSAGRRPTSTTRRPRGRLLFPRRGVLSFLMTAGLLPDERELGLGPYVGVRQLARLLDVSPSWIRSLHRRGALYGEYLRPPTCSLEGGR